MKKFVSLLLLLTVVFENAQSQNYFDSASYVHYYHNLYPAFKIDSTIQRTDLTTEEKIEGLSKVWYEAKFNFANFDLVPHLNWDSAYRQFIPRCLATNNILDYYKVLKQFNQLLRDGHSRVTEPPYYFSKSNEYVPLVCQYINQQVVLTEILDADTAYTKASIGWIIEKIDGTPVQQYIREMIAPYINFSTAQDSIARIYRYELLKGAANSRVTISFRDEKNKIVVQSFKRKSWDTDENPVQFKVLKNNIGYLKLNSFNTGLVVEIFDSLFNTISKANGLIIDIRSNGGGSSNYGYEILGRLTDKPFYTSMNITRTYRPTSRAWSNEPIKIDITKWDWKPYKPNPYLKPVVLLTGPSTYSAAEDFTVAFRSAKRGLIIGCTTGGSTGQPMGYNLPGGGLGFVCSKRDVQPDGEEFVGRGISPDKTVFPTLAGIRNGQDEVLEVAKQFLYRNKQF